MKNNKTTSKNLMKCNDWVGKRAYISKFKAQQYIPGSKNEFTTNKVGVVRSSCKSVCGCGPCGGCSH